MIKMKNRRRLRDNVMKSHEYKTLVQKCIIGCGRNGDDEMLMKDGTIPPSSGIQDKVSLLIFGNQFYCKGDDTPVEQIGLEMIFTWVKQGTGKGKHSDEDWLSPTVKGGCRCIYKGVPGMDLKNQRFFYRPLLQN